MTDSTKTDGDELDFPQQFLDQVEALCEQTDEAGAWAKLLYEDWFVCPTSRLAETLEISICRRRDYVGRGTDASERLDVLVDSCTLGESSTAAGFELPHVSLRELIVESVERLIDWSPNEVVHANDKEQALRLIADIEADVTAAIAELRSKLT
ncbi:MAG: hypothetical protein ACO3VO_00170 [Ilumatobacteraceae bacterium]